MFTKYQHIERLGTSETDGILNGMCYITPKIDGTNASMWFDAGIKFGGRNRELTPGKNTDERGFAAKFGEDERVIRFFNDNPTIRLFGEYLIKNHIRTYNENAWFEFYIFDAYDGEDIIPYPEMKALIEPYGLTVIPTLWEGENPTEEILNNCLSKTGEYLCTEGVGEGIVIKNYNYRNKYGRQTWAKIITQEYASSHKVKMARMPAERATECAIAEKYMTQDYIKKEYAKFIEIIEKEGLEWGSKLIARALHTIWHEFLKEEAYNFVKEFKNPTINFKILQDECFDKIKKIILT